MLLDAAGYRDARAGIPGDIGTNGAQPPMDTAFRMVTSIQTFRVLAWVAGVQTGHIIESEGGGVLNCAGAIPLIQQQRQAMSSRLSLPLAPVPPVPGAVSCPMLISGSHR
jgi:hypothetical protein